MGIRALEPGWSTFRIKPQLGNLTRAAISVPSIRVGTLRQNEGWV